MVKPVTVALVTLVREAKKEPSEARELIDQIRAALESSGITQSWAIEKITVLEGPEPTTSSGRIVRSTESLTF